MAAIIFGFVILTVVLTASFIWVTNKAYSRKWEEEPDDRTGE